MIGEFGIELEKLADRIHRNPLLDLLHFDIAEPISEASLHEIEISFGAPLPASLCQLYRSLGSAVLRWRFRPDLDEITRGQVREEFAASVTRNSLYSLAGAVDILPLGEVLFGEDNSLPESDPDEDEFAFEGVTYSGNEFCRMVRPFDAINDFFAMAFVVQPGVSDWKMIHLSDYWIEYDYSRVTYLADYLQYVIATWGLINSREEIFSEYQGGRMRPLEYSEEIAESKVPRILRLRN